MESIQNFQVTTSDAGILVEEIIFEVMNIQVDQMMVFRSACVEKDIDQLDFRIKLPKYAALFPSKGSESGLPGYQSQEWYEVKGSLEEQISRIYMTDMSRDTMLSDIQFQSTVEAEAMGFAWIKDNTVRDALIAAVPAVGGIIPASGPWNDGATDIARDIAGVIGAIFATTPIAESEIRDIHLYFPAVLWGFMAKPIEIGQIQQSIRQWSQQNFNIAFHPTRSLDTDALVVLRGNRCARILNYTFPKRGQGGLRPVEYERRAGQGDVYIYKQTYLVKVMPDDEDVATNSRIRCITNVYKAD
jgi:hypothetical protein